MPGRFEGMSDAEWELFKNIFPEKARKVRGMPAAHLHKIEFTAVYFSDRLSLVRGGQWALKSASHRWLKAWHSDGRLKALQALLLGTPQNAGLIYWKSGAVDGSFSMLKRRLGGCCS